MNTKKFVAFLLVLAMVLSVPVAASAAETTTIASNISVSGGWQGVCEVYTTNWGGSLNPNFLSEDGYFTLVVSSDNLWSVQLALNGATWAQVDRDVSEGTLQDDGSYVFYIGYDDCVAAYGSDFSTLGAVYVYVNSPEDGTGVTMHSLTYTSSDSAEEPEEPEVTATYVVAGTSGLCGSEWNAVDTANQMSDEDGDGVYTITYTGVAPGSYEFKVVENLSDGTQNWYGDSSWNNVVLSVNAKCDVTISIDTASHTVSYSISNVELEDDGTKYIVAGVSELCGSYWDPSDSANQMSDEDGDGIYTITYTGVEPGNYEYKVVANLPDGTQNWLCNDGWSNEVVCVEEACDVTISYNAYTNTISASGSGVNTEEEVLNYILAGTSNLCGSDWDVSDVNNEMTDEDGDGVYTIAYHNVEPGSYEFKVVENMTNGTRNWLTNSESGNNMKVELTWKSSITVSYNTATGEIVVYVEGKAYDAYLCFGDADWWPSCSVDYPPVTCQVDGEGNYTLTWDVANTCWQATEGMSVFYIDILNAYAEIHDNTVVTNVSVKVDGEEVPVNMDNVKVYDSEGSYRIELYNMYGGSASAVDTGMVINDTLIVTFTLGSGNASTGDSTNLALLCGTMLVTAMGIVALVVTRKKFF